MKSRDSIVPPRRASGRSSTSAAVFALTMFLSLPRESAAESSVSAKYEDYREEGGRIAVKAQYLSADVDLGSSSHLSVSGVVDAITGATPTGQRPEAGSDQVPLSNLVETRAGVVAGFTQALTDGRARVEYARSVENDYLSNGYSVSYVREFNQKNTEVQVGMSYNSDTISEPFWTESRNKLTRDFLIGVTQLIDPNTTIAVNLSHGLSTGYMSDPYKIVQFSKEIVPGFFLDGYTTPEHRPSSRRKDALFVRTVHFFENAHGSLDSSFRYYTDSHGINSGTLELAWFQRLGKEWILRPAVRFYRQSAADFYIQNLDLTALKPNDEPLPNDPFYSSDYRLSKFDATTVGLKLIYNHDDRWGFDVMWERYAMKGKDGVTPASSYATANTITAGFKLWF